MAIDPAREEELSKSPFAAYGRFQSFVAGSVTSPAGRIAAIVNPRLVDGNGLPFGQVGCFDCVDDASVASALFDRAESWLRSEGCRTVLGPMNGGAHRPHRLQVSGFDRPPFVSEPRNPPYFAALFEAQGYRTLRTWQTFELALSDLRVLLDARGFKRAALRARRHYRIDPLDTRDAPACLARLHALLDGVWAGHVGYASLDPPELTEALGGVLGLMSDRTIGVVVDGNGRDVGTAFMFPDVATPSRIILHTLAFLPDARRHGAPFLIVEQGLDHLVEDGFTDVTVALVADDFPLFGKIAKPTRTYALFAKDLAISR